MNAKMKSRNRSADGIQDVVQMEKRNQDARSGIDQLSWAIRMSQEADRRAQLDLQINILAERETTMILRMLDEISAHLEIGGSTRSEREELLRIDELARKLDEALPSH